VSVKWKTRAPICIQTFTTSTSGYFSQAGPASATRRYLPSLPTLRKQPQSQPQFRLAQPSQILFANDRVERWDSALWYRPSISARTNKDSVATAACCTSSKSCQMKKRPSPTSTIASRSGMSFTTRRPLGRLVCRNHMPVTIKGIIAAVSHMLHNVDPCFKTKWSFSTDSRLL
jgi:hypothetical protein